MECNLCLDIYTCIYLQKIQTNKLARYHCAFLHITAMSAALLPKVDTLRALGWHGFRLRGDSGDGRTRLGDPSVLEDLVPNIHWEMVQVEKAMRGHNHEDYEFSLTLTWCSRGNTGETPMTATLLLWMSACPQITMREAVQAYIVLYTVAGMAH